MAIDADDLEPRRAKAKLRDLTPMSVEDLQHYIAELEDEITRAAAAIAKKEAHRSGIDALFGGPKK